MPPAYLVSPENPVPTYTPAAYRANILVSSLIDHNISSVGNVLPSIPVAGTAVYFNNGFAGNNGYCSTLGNQAIGYYTIYNDYLQQGLLNPTMSAKQASMEAQPSSVVNSKRMTTLPKNHFVAPNRGTR